MYICVSKCSTLRIKPDVYMCVKVFYIEDQTRCLVCVSKCSTLRIKPDIYMCV